MLGALQATHGHITVSRFRTRRVACLLAYLAFYRERSHRRTEIGELLWPEHETKAILHNLRQALLSLRHQLEPPPIPGGTILVASPSELKLAPSAFTTDVADFEALVKVASNASDDEERLEMLVQATALYKGDLLPGFEDEWVVRERLRLEDLYVSTLRDLIELFVQRGRMDEAAHHMRLALTKEPFDEALHVALMRHYLSSGRPSSAIQQFKELRRTLAEQLRVEPSEESRQIASEAKKALSAETTHGRSAERRPFRASPSTLASEHDELLKPRSRLPKMLTRFVGRSDELKLIVNAFNCQETRLLTVVGPAGTGKTTLGLEAGRIMAEDHGWQVIFIPLADLTEAMILDELADRVGVRRSAREDLIYSLRATILPFKTLMIFDNLEHIVERAVPVISFLLQELSEVAIMTTSRQSTKIYGEREVDLRPFPVPHDVFREDATSNWGDSPESLEHLSKYSSVQLFVNRCQLVRPDFQLTKSNAQDVAALCTRLEGLPLALEIAAGLSSVFSVSQIRTQLVDRMTTLSSRRRDVTPRHRSLRAAIEYSVETLSPRLQRFFFAISVFRGGFTLDGAAEIVCPWIQEKEGESASTVSASLLDDALNMILSLQERSLLFAVTQCEDEVARFRLIEAFREYAQDQLTPEDHKLLGRRHASHFLARSKEPGKSGHAGFISSGLPPPPELGNLRAATSYFFESGDFESCVRMLFGRHSFMIDGAWTFERDLLARLSELPEAHEIDPAVRLLLLYMNAKTLVFSTRYEEAHHLFSEALMIAEALDDKVRIAQCRRAISSCLSYNGNDEESLRWLEDIPRLVATSDMTQELESAYQAIGTTHWQLGDLSAAEEAFRRAARASQELRNGETFWLVNYNLARVCMDQGRFDEAMTLTGDAMRKAKSSGEFFAIGLCYFSFGRYYWHKKDLQSALENNYESLIYKRRTAFIYWIANGIAFHALLLAELGERELSVTLFGAVNRHGQLKGLPHREFIECLESLRGSLSPQTFERAWARGLAMDVYEAFQLISEFRTIG